MKSSRKLSEERSFPSTLMERGTSGRRLTAAFRKASARERQGRETRLRVRREYMGEEKEIGGRRVKLTLREALIGQGHLAGQQVEAEAAEDAAERRDGDEAVGSAGLEVRGAENEDKWKHRR